MDYLHHDTRCSRLSSFMISVAPSAEQKALSPSFACCIISVDAGTHLRFLLENHCFGGDFFCFLTNTVTFTIPHPRRFCKFFCAIFSNLKRMAEECTFQFSNLLEGITKKSAIFCAYRRVFQKYSFIFGCFANWLFDSSLLSHKGIWRFLWKTAIAFSQWIGYNK